jgi:PAS domain S-box-containing protein
MTARPRTPPSETLQKAIVQELGYLPPFLAPALSEPEVLEDLWTRARACLVAPPLPPLARDRLLASLSRFCPHGYFAVVHACALAERGIAPPAIRALLEQTPTLLADPEAPIRSLAAAAPLTEWPEDDGELEAGLRACLLHAFLATPLARRASAELVRLLGVRRAHRLLLMLADVRALHLWVEANPAVSAREDPRVRARLGALLEAEPTLAALFERPLPGVAPSAPDASTAQLRDRLHALERVQTALQQELVERRQAELALREGERRLRTILDGSSALVFVKDTGGRYRLVNRRFTEVVGRPRAEILGRADAELFDAALAETMGQHDRRVLLTAREEEFEEVVAYRGEQRRYLTLRFPLADESGRISGICGIATDITERARLEEQLRRAQKLEAVGRLAAGVAHDFNNLIGAIRGGAELLLMDTPPGDPRREELDEILDASARATTLTRQLLAYGSGQAPGRMVLDLRAVVAGLVPMIRRLVGPAVTLLVEEPDSEPARVEADGGQLEQVVVNLAVNARDAMPDGGTITIAVHASGDEPWIRLVVADTGVGMDEATRERIFEPFFTTKPEGRGTGLGLATVQAIVEGAGGEVGVASTQGHGTTFEVRLPRAAVARAAPSAEPVDVEAPPAEGAPAPALPERGPGAAAGTGRTILLVDDERALRVLAAKVLRREGYTVLEAANGVEALELLERDPAASIDLLLTDVVMPRMGGGPLAERARALRPGLPVLYMSGYADAETVVREVAAEGTPFLAKPFMPAALLGAVREALEKTA